ncbi:MAG TPA: manganese ABC transporter ATP-binding protein [Cyanobacteria bacterium UBA11370]|nr:manganese ABC transporter ATP-binding protein [Cyanobacteria bacterium UBA11370]HBY81874.1 manganese ABC transporter ATP-binding protein [Cyanobacteria bacterium UBA11148]
MISATFPNIGSTDTEPQYRASSIEQISPVTIKQLSVQYRMVEALKDVNCHIEPGQLTGIIGPNGAGKSTLIKAMLGLVPTSRGTAMYQGKALMEQLDRVAYVPQRSQIDWTYPATVWDVVLMGRVRKTGWFRRFSTVSRRLAVAALERVGMSEFCDRPIGQLSGGQQQRVFLAKALAEEAEIFCLDEPMAGIDKKTEGIVFKILHELAEAGKTVLVVHHDLGEAITNFDNLILLNRELIAYGSRQEVMSANNLQRAYGGQVVFFSEAA